MCLRHLHGRNLLFCVTRNVVGLNTTHKPAASKPTKREKEPMGIAYTNDHRLMALWSTSIDSWTLSGC
jgi:hypothetical protein